MNRKSTSKASRDERIDRMRDQDIDFSDIPEVTAEQMKRARVRFQGKPLSPGKVQINLALDAAIVAYFKTQARGRSFQKLINDALKDKIRDQNFETVLRRVIREEIQAAG